MNTPTMRGSIYLAGFDVFRSDAKAYGEHLKALCAASGWAGLFPLDNEIPQCVSPGQMAQWIYEANIGLIRRADALIANLNNFRGLEPDSGTAFEVGFAAALGKPIVAYLDDARPMIDQVGAPTDTAGLHVEDFGLPRNLMLACSASIVQGGLPEALEALGKSLQT